MQVWKYVIRNVDLEVEFEMPKGARVLDVQTQFDEVCFWALVDPSKKTMTRTFRIFGTGWDIPTEEHTTWEFKKVDYCPYKYVGTSQTVGGAFVWHLFEKVKR